MNQSLKKEMLKSIDVARQSIKNSMEISLESYTEILSRLDLMTFMLINEKESNV